MRHFKDLKGAFIKRGNNPESLGYYFERAMRVDRTVLLQYKEKPATQENLQVVTFKKALPNL